MTNSGGTTAANLTAASPTSPFSFTGGTYPGTGGTCGDRLEPGQSCSVALSFTSPLPPAAAYAGEIRFDFFDGALNRQTQLALRGESDNGPFNRARGFNNGVSSLTVVGDRLLISGAFESYSGMAAKRLVALDSQSLEVDPSFVLNGGFNSVVFAATEARDGSGDIYMGGNFTSFDGTTGVNYITRLNSDGSRDAGFAVGTGFNGLVRVITAANDGSLDIYVGGDFTDFNGFAVNRIVRLNADGTRDAGFNVGTGADATIRTLVLANDGSGDIYAGGALLSYNSVAVNYIVRIDSNGARDAGFATGAAFNGSVQAILPAPDGLGDVYAAGVFTQFNGTPNINRLVRLNSNGTRDAGFAVGTALDADGWTLSAAADGTQDIFVGGNFTIYNGTANVGRILRLRSDGSRDTAFATGTGFNDYVWSIVPSPDGSGDFLVAGDFTQFNGTMGVNRIVRLNTDGTPDSTFPVGMGFDAFTRWLEPARDGSGDLYVGGAFTAFDGVIPNNRLLRLNPDGSQDAAFNVGTGVEDMVRCLAVETGGDIYVAGQFSTFKGTAGQGRILRLNPDGTQDAAFVTGTGFNNTTRALALPQDGSSDVYVAGDFTSFNGTPAINRIVRLNNDGSRDLGFSTGTAFDNSVYVLALAGDGDVYAGGDFTNYNGTPSMNRIIRLNPDGSRDAAFATGTGFNALVFTLAVEPNSQKVYVGGDFTNYNGTAGVNRIARLNTDGSLDTAFSVGTGFDLTVYTSAVDSDGDIYLGGDFTTFNGVTGVSRIVRLSPNGSLNSVFSTTGFDNGVYSLARSLDGTQDLYVGGVFTSFNGVTHGYIARLSGAGMSE